MRIHPLAELSVLLVDRGTMTDLHERWMGEPGPTDVLAFPMDELRPPPPGSAAGTRAPAARRPRRRACSATSCSARRSPPTRRARRSHPLRDELELLCTHGILHLLGYDHAEPDERSRHVRPPGRAARHLALRAGISHPARAVPRKGRKGRGEATMVWLIVAAAALALGAGLCASAEVALMRVSAVRRGGTGPAAARAAATAPPPGSRRCWPSLPGTWPCCCWPGSAARPRPSCWSPRRCCTGSAPAGTCSCWSGSSWPPCCTC